MEFLQAAGVIGTSVRQAPRAAVAGRLGFEPIPRRQERPIAALEGPGHRFARGGDQSRLFGVGDGQLADLRLEVREHGRIRAAFEGRAIEHALSVGADGREVEARGNDPLLRLPAHVGADLVHHSLDIAETGNIGLGVGDAVDPVLVDEEDRKRARRAAVGARREAVPAPAIVLDALLSLFGKQAVAEPACGAQPGRIELRFEFRELPLSEFEVLPTIFFRVGVEAIVLLLDPERCQRLGTASSIRVEGRVEESHQPPVLGRRVGGRGRGRHGLRCRGRRRRNVCGAGGGEEKGGDQRGSKLQRFLHRDLKSADVVASARIPSTVANGRSSNECRTAV